MTTKPTNVSVEDVFDYFGGRAKAARALGISRQAVDQWNGTIPELQARKLVEIDGFPWTLAELPWHKFRAASNQ